MAPSSRPIPARDRPLRQAGEAIVRLVREKRAAFGSADPPVFRKCPRARHGDGRLAPIPCSIPSAIAREAGVPLEMEDFNAIAARVPQLCKVAPSGIHHMEDIDRAGGIGAILKTLSEKPGLLHLDVPTVSGRTLGEILENAEVRDSEVIRPWSRAYSASGGLAILFGNPAPGGCVVKAAGVAPAMMQFTGPAIIFDSQEDGECRYPDGPGEGG